MSFITEDALTDLVKFSKETLDVNATVKSDLINK